MLATFIYNTIMDWIGTWFKIIWLSVVKSEFVYFIYLAYFILFHWFVYPSTDTAVLVIVCIMV